jgi:serine/threonine protein kinase
MYRATATTVESEALVKPVSYTLFICAVDGSVYTLDALTGMAKGYFRTGRPLVAASSPNVVSGLDGHIYMLSDEDVQVLPMTVYQVVQHPVQTCHSDDSNQCGIVTGTKLTYLYALDPITGRLEWTQQYGKMKDTNESSEAVVVLQRQDYIVRHISALTGEEVWNVTLGHVSALDFSSLPKDMLPGQVEEAPEKLLDTMPEIAFGTDGMTITAMDSNHQVLWKRRLNTVIASVYGSVGNGWVPLTVLEATEQLEDASNSMTTLLLPASADRPQERDMYLELLWQEIQNMATTSVDVSDMVIYQPPRWDRASAELNRIVHKAASRAQQTCAGGTINGVCQDRFLLGSENNKDFPPPQPVGLFLSWITVVEGMVVLVLLMGIGLRFLYRRKKRQWMAEQRKALFQERIEHIRNDMVLSTHSDKPIIPRSVRWKKSVSLPVELHRSVSLPVLHPAPVREPLANISHLGQVKLVRTSTAPTVTDTSGDSTGNIDGIPLVRYSRYKSEFRELAPLGRGGFGTVFRCENALDGREYAIKKVWIPSGEEFSQRLQRVLREVKILALLDHPNIVRYYTAWLELEDDKERGEKNLGEESTTTNGCFSSELPTTGLTASDGRRPSPISKKGRPLYKSSNPLGWNGIVLDAELDDELVDGERGDFGFLFEPSSDSLNGRRPTFRRSTRVLPAIDDNSGDESFGTSYNGSSFSDNASQSSFSSQGRDPRISANATLSPISKTRDNKTETQLSSDQGASPPKKKEEGHMLLYIQMQLCSQKTLGDFLANPQARKGTPDKDAVDIPLALGLFHQIAQGVKHVHEQGLIHRDLKPCNCFIDDAGVVKVGDFGLSRESGDIGEDSNLSILGDGDDDNTAGVGTRSYASPEQMNGSDYGASTDVYSLGILLFELCYPMSTVSHVVLSGKKCFATFIE